MANARPLASMTTILPAVAPARRWRLQSFRRLVAAPAAVPGARRHARHVLWAWGLGRLVDPAELVVSELVTHAIRATLAMAEPLPVRLWLAADPARAAIGVWDSSPDPPRPARAADVDESGRGLFLVEALSASWDWYPQEGGKVVHALLELDHPTRVWLAAAQDDATTGVHPRASDLPTGCDGCVRRF
jgi:anti-sigma regulatory factor (Ser/Thr protein kinase)